jgi:hypothetical protein
MTALIPFPAPSGLPALVRSDIKQLATALDRLVELGERMYAAWEALDDAKALGVAKRWLQAYDNEARERVGSYKALNARLQAQLAPEWWETDALDSPVRRSAIMQSAMALIGFYNQAVKDDYFANLLEYLANLNPHPYDIAEAWEDLKLEKAHPPAIAEVRKFYLAASSRWGNRLDWLEGIEQTASDLEKAIARIEEEERQRLAREEQQRLEREARAKRLREERERERQTIVSFLNGID